jgi:hypothetical protein
MEDLILFLGRFHVLALHLPIGILAFVAIAELYFGFKPNAERPALVNTIWLLGAVSAVIAAGLGYLLSLSGGYNEDTLELHLIWGLITSATALIGWVAFGIKGRRGKGWAITIGGIQLVALFTAGHLGGNLTHGPEYLFEHAPNPIRSLAGFEPKSAPRTPVSDLAQADVFLDVVQPLLELRCVTCHNPSKIKGGLLLDTYANIMLGGDSGAAVTPGNLSASELSVRINHDPAHDDYMPSGGKTPFTAAQTQVMDWWILAVAPESGTLSDLGVDTDTLDLIAAAIEVEVTVSHLDELGLPIVTAASRDVIMKLESLGFDATPVSEKSGYLDIDFYRIGQESISDEHIAALLQARDHIAWLNLGNSGLQDHQIETIAQLSNLLKLDLSKNPVTDTGIIPLRSLPNLQTLNLHATKITDDALPTLDKLPNLEQAFLWSTAVTTEASTTRPYARIETGFIVVPAEDDESNE